MHNTKQVTSFNNTYNDLCQFSSLPLSVMSPLDDPVKQLTAATKLHHNMHIQGIFISTLDGLSLSSVEAIYGEEEELIELIWTVKMARIRKTVGWKPNEDQVSLTSMGEELKSKKTWS